MHEQRIRAMLPLCVMLSMHALVSMHFLQRFAVRGHEAAA
jgi:hypothetical protein